MNLSQKVAPHISNLRRFSRELTGNERSADTYVAVLLESIIADPSGFNESTDVRVSLFQRFCQLWESIPFSVRMKHVVGRHAELSPKAREATLLTELEGFTPNQVGQILSCEPAVVAALIREALQTFDCQIDTEVPTIGVIHSNAYRRDLGVPQPAHRRHIAPGPKRTPDDLKQAPVAGSA